ncbi:hypothetical protein ACP70R_011986 [Stipagrostis hirtigluma subsp. patula]
MIFPASSSASLDSPSWNNTNQLQQSASYNNITPSPPAAGEGNLLQNESAMAAVSLPRGGGGGDGGFRARPAKPLSMPERARLAGMPQPDSGLKCPRCDSTNTKFCYFNNYSLKQPRHFCRACRRHWTRGGTHRSIPVGSGYRRHAKRAKPKSAASTAAATAPSASVTPPSSIACATTLQAMTNCSASPMLPPLPEYQFMITDMDMASLAGLSFPVAGASSAQGMEQQWTMIAQSHVHRFPFLHALLDQPMELAMPMPSMFYPGSLSGGSEDVGEFHVTPMTRDQQEFVFRATNGDMGHPICHCSGSTAGINL